MIEMIGKPFVRVGSAMRQSNGSVGPGLTIESKLMAVHGGPIGIDSLQLRGVRISLVFPDSRLARPAASTVKTSTRRVRVP